MNSILPALISGLVSILIGAVGYFGARRKVNAESSVFESTAAAKNVETSLKLVDALIEDVEKLTKKYSDLQVLYEDNQLRISHIETGVKILERQIRDLGHEPKFDMSSLSNF